LASSGGEFFVPELHGTRQYPEASTVFATQHGTFQIPCTLIQNGTSIEISIEALRCPSGLIARDDGQLEDYCLFPCPSFVFEEEDYTAMQSASVVFGIFALLGNSFMVITYGFLPKKTKSQFALLNISAVFGLLWCIIEIVPSLLLGNNVACSCDTELCYHDSTVCSLSEISIFVHQGLFIALACYMGDSYLTILKEMRPTQRDKLYPFFGIAIVGIPSVNMALTLALSSFEESDQNYHLNALRSSFSCHPQLSTMWEEVLLLYSSTLVCCLLIFFMVSRLVAHIYKVSMKSASAGATASFSAKLGALQRLKRLIWMGMIVLVLFLIYLSVTVYYAQIMSEFGKASEEWKVCAESVNQLYPLCLDAAPGEFLSCLNLEYALRTVNTFDGGCKQKPENSPSLSIMVLCFAAPSGVALTAPLIFGTGEQYIKQWPLLRNAQKAVISSMKSTTRTGTNNMGGSSSRANSSGASVAPSSVVSSSVVMSEAPSSTVE
jgi:hypothetical protein